MSNTGTKHKYPPFRLALNIVELLPPMNDETGGKDMGHKANSAMMNSERWQTEPRLRTESIGYRPQILPQQWAVPDS